MSNYIVKLCLSPPPLPQGPKNVSKRCLNIPMFFKKKKNCWYVGKACNANPTSTYPPWNTHHITGLHKWGVAHQTC